MAKRNKVKVASKSRKSALRVEALEQRQLLAAVTGGGTEVGTDIIHSNGNVYDQVLLTGSSVTVTADPGQVTRVSFLDLSGDIVQAEFGGQGTLTITLDQFGAAAPADNYNQPGVNYVSGLATFTIQGSNADTNFGVFTVGSATAAPSNASLFEGGKTGGNNVADIAALRIVADPQNPGGFSTFGGIRTGNAVFAANSGTVGISAANVNAQGPVIIGDIDASDSGVPTLNFGANSQFSTLILSGGDLAQTNGGAFVSTGGSFTTINSQDGTSSAGVLAGSMVVNAAAAGSLGVDAVTLDSSESIDLTGATQAQINDWFTGRTFTNDLTITGDLGVIFGLEAADFRGEVAFNGDILGDITVDGGFGSLVVTGNVEGVISAEDGDIGSLSVTGDLEGSIWAANVGNVLIDGDLSGLITTDLDNNNVFSTGEGMIGNVTVTGDVTGDGAVEGVLGIGNVSVQGDVDSDGGAQLGIFSTHSGASGDSFLANIGTLTVDGVVDTGTGETLINITNNGTFGNVTIAGAQAVGRIVTGGATLGGTEAASTGTISISEDEENVSWGGLSVASTEGTTGDVTITGGGENEFTLADDVNITGTDAGGITVSGFAEITIDDTIIAQNGAVTLSAEVEDSVITINADIGDDDTDLGPVVINGGSDGSTVTFAADISGDDIDSVSVTAETITMTAGGLLAAGDTGDITLNGDTTIGATIALDGDVGAFTINGEANFNGDIAIGDAASLTVNDTTTFAAGVTVTTGSISGTVTLTDAAFDAGSQLLIAGDAGWLTLNGDTDFSANTQASVVLNDGDDALDVLGGITIDGSFVGFAGLDITASQIGDIGISGTLTQDESLVTDLTVLAGPNTTEFVFLDGTNLSDYSIGNISVASTLDLAFTGTALFAGDNAFAALGAIGDVSFMGGVTGAQQSMLLTANTDSVAVVAGDIDGFDNTTTADGSGAIFLDDEDDDTGAAFADPDYTDGSVSIGDISVNARQSDSAGNNSGVDNIGGLTTASEATLHGLVVLSGVKSTDGSGDIITLTGAGGGYAASVADIDADLQGSIGDILIQSNNAVAFLDDTATAANLVGPFFDADADFMGAIAAATDVGTQQVAGAATDDPGASVVAVIGDDDATEDNTVENTDQIVVVIV